MYKEIVFGVPRFAGSVARAILDQVVQQVFKLLLDVKSALAGGEDVRVFVQSWEIEEEWFEDCFFDDGLEFFDTCIGLLKALSTRKQLKENSIGWEEDKRGSLYQGSLRP